MNKVQVSLVEKSKQYYGKGKVLEKKEFGKYSEESYQEAVMYFKNLVSNTI